MFTPPRVTRFQIRNYTPNAVSVFWPFLWTHVHIFLDVEQPQNRTNCTRLSLHVFLKVFDFRKGDTMQVYWLTDRSTGEATLVDGDSLPLSQPSPTNSHMNAKAILVFLESILNCLINWKSQFCSMQSNLMTRRKK